MKNHKPLIVAQLQGPYIVGQEWFAKHKLKPRQPRAGDWALVFTPSSTIELIKVKWHPCSSDRQRCKIAGQTCYGLVDGDLCCLYGSCRNRDEWLIYPLNSEEEALAYML